MNKFPKHFFVYVFFLLTSVILGAVWVSLFQRLEKNKLIYASQFKNFPILENPSIPKTYSLVCRLNSVDGNIYYLKSKNSELTVYKSANCSFIDKFAKANSVWVPLAINNIKNSTSFLFTKGNFEGIFEPPAIESAFHDINFSRDVAVTFSVDSNLPLESEKMWSSYITDIYEHKLDYFSDFLETGDTTKIPTSYGKHILVPLDIQFVSN